MEFKLNFEMNNEMFDEDPEGKVATMLRSVGKRVCDGQTEGSVVDWNGNKIGDFEIIFVD